MPQRHLPLFPQGVTHITLELAFMKECVGYAPRTFSSHDMVMTQTPNDALPLRWNRESTAIIRCLAGVMVRDAYPTAQPSDRSGAWPVFLTKHRAPIGLEIPGSPQYRRVYPRRSAPARAPAMKF